MRNGLARLPFEGNDISLDLKAGIFITMNPHYAGRTELPDNLKALFRPVVMVVPDLELICEIMLFSEGESIFRPGKAWDEFTSLRSQVSPKPNNSPER